MPVSSPGALVISNQTITPAGHMFILPDTPACDTGTQQQCNFWIAGQHLRQVVSYQPASRYWALRVRPGSPHGYRVGGCQVGGCQSVRRLDG